MDTPTQPLHSQIPFRRCCLCHYSLLRLSLLILSSGKWKRLLNHSLLRLSSPLVDGHAYSATPLTDYNLIFIYSSFFFFYFLEIREARGSTLGWWRGRGASLSSGSFQSCPPCPLPMIPQVGKYMSLSILPPFNVYIYNNAHRLRLRLNAKHQLGPEPRHFLEWRVKTTYTCVWVCGLFARMIYTRLRTQGGRSVGLFHQIFRYAI